MKLCKKCQMTKNERAKRKSGAGYNLEMAERPFCKECAAAIKARKKRAT